MKSFRKEIYVEYPRRRGFLNITPQVNECLKESGIKEGLLLCNAMHITASVFINDNESGLHHDFETWLEELAPFNPDPDHYFHNRTGEDNADACMSGKAGVVILAAALSSWMYFWMASCDFWRFS